MCFECALNDEESLPSIISVFNADGSEFRRHKQTRRLKKLFSRKEFSRTRELLEDKQHDRDEYSLNAFYWQKNQILMTPSSDDKRHDQLRDYFKEKIDDIQKYYPDFVFNLYDSPQ